MSRENFHRGTRRVASYTYKDSYEDYRNSPQYKEDLNCYKKQ